MRSILALVWLFRLLLFSGLTLLLCTRPCTDAEAKVFYSKEEALATAFPDSETVETRTFFLTAEQQQRAAALATAPIESQLVSVYVGRKAGHVLGYAFIETNVVRTLPETFLIVVSPQGVVQRLFVLAFYEPEEYLPSNRWLRQFDDKPLTPALQLRRDIHGIAGSTLTSRAVTNGVRKTLALFQILIQEGH